MSISLIRPAASRDSETQADTPVVDVAVVIPAYNEADGVGPTIDRVHAALNATPFTFDVVVVDDGSSDTTADRAAAHDCRVVRSPQNRGYGSALKTGIRHTRSEYVAIIDADGTYPPETIPRLLGLMHGADMAVGARAPDDLSIARRRRPAKKVLGLLASYLAGRRIPDLNSGLRVIRRSALMEFLHILPQGFSFTTTISMALLCNNREVMYLPVTCTPRVGSSKLRAKEFTTFIMLVLRTVVLFNPLKVFLPLGAVLFLIGCAKLVYDLYIWNLSDTAVMALLAAIIVWSVGLLADMIARVQLNLRGSS